MRNYEQFKKRVLKNRDVRQEYDALGPEFAIITLLMQWRLHRRITQRQLAARVGTKQSAISRLESGTYNPSLVFLHKVADALDVRLEVSIGAK